MLTDFFQTTAIPADQLKGVYDSRLVILSYLVAVFASYIALDLTGRLRDKNNTPTSTRMWLIGGAIAMGAGIWSMHFIGMLSFTIPGLTLQYEFVWTAFSLLVAILASAFALYLLKSNLLNVIHLVAGGVILGLAIASMHYTGMEAMLITLNIRYLPTLFFLSILIAIVASEAAIWLALKSNKVILRLRNRIKFGSAIIMGLAICGMHYTGMAASIFTPLCVPAVATTTTSLNPQLLAMAVATLTIIILTIAFVASNYKEAFNQHQYEKARQLGMDEISASVLHNVGNVLNSVNVSAHTINEKMSHSKLSNLEKLSVLLNENKNNLSDFLTQDAKGSKIVDFINELSQYWAEEKKVICVELERLLKNTLLIKEIISTQQNLNKTIGFENIISINELVDEGILISGLDLKQNIKIEKKYGKINSIIVDKIKFLQILVNVLRNARDAVIASAKNDKQIVIKTSVYHNQKVIIEIADNGIGILPKNLNKIFYHGFTTKETGHGFGLHASALSINELGGEIHAESEGQEKGAVFTLELPYKTPK